MLKAVEAGGAAEALFFVSHPHAAAVALASRQHATSHLEIPYWSTTPYLFGAGRAVKYIVRPGPARTTPLPDPLTDNYLRERLAAHLAHEEARFDFLVQFQTDARKMPIEDASVEWREHDSPYRRVAADPHPRSNAREPRRPRRASRCRSIRGTPWRIIARSATSTARGGRFTAMAAFRRDRAVMSLRPRARSGSAIAGSSARTPA